METELDGLSCSGSKDIDNERDAYGGAMCLWIESKHAALNGKQRKGCLNCHAVPALI